MRMPMSFDRRGLLCLMVMAACASAGAVNTEPRGQLDWPEEWWVLAPFERDDPPLSQSLLTAIPEQFVKSDGTVITPRRIRVERGGRHDLKDFFDEQRIGNVAWLFTAVHSDRAQTATLGMGADWWFTAWLNGEEVLATPESGNSAWPPSARDQTAEVALRAGENILAVRYVTGGASALFAAGGPAEIRAAVDAIGGSEDPQRFNQPLPFAQRMPFPRERQAIAAAGMDLLFPAAETDLSAGSLAGLQKLPKRQLELSELHGRARVLDTEYRRFAFEPVKLRLSKHRYPVEDRHLDVLVWTTPMEDDPHTGSLEIYLKDVNGRMLASNTIDEVSDTGWFFSLGWPPDLAGQSGTVTAAWMREGREIGRDSVSFVVAPPADVARSGRIPVEILNAPGARIRNAPMTVGVPFPRGALYDDTPVRLVDERGHAIALQTRVTGRWSRFGAIKWLLCDFTADLDGAPRTLHLEYGGAVARPGVLGRLFGQGRPEGSPGITVVGQAADFPIIDAGRLRVDANGVAFDRNGDGVFEPVLSRAALYGAFVEHADGRRFGVPVETEHVVEELNTEKLVVRRTGWYAEEDQATLFCNFVTRFIFYRDSPVVRIYHTWIFTGDGNRDRIRAMGWQFDTAAALQPEGFLTSFTNGTWMADDHLVQYDYQSYNLAAGGTNIAGRTPGVLSARVGDTRLLFGAKDFWQNFPSELEFGEQAFTFYNWPRHNPPAFTPAPVPAGEAFRLRYAHEGEWLDFRTPEEYADGTIWQGATLDGRDAVWPRGDRDFINAQGVARTEEFFLLFVDQSADKDQAAAVMRGLNDETLRAVADPVWMAASGAFERIRHRDVDNYPQEELLYEEICHAPARWNERLGAYGMWVHGDFPVDSANLSAATASPRRTWKKGHHGWPYKWVPFARSGDPRLFKYAEAASRQMVDGNFKHYADHEIAPSITEMGGQGWTGTSLFPWHRCSLRSISQDVDHLWHNWCLTGFQRPRDVALLWMELVKLDTAAGLPGRISVSQMHYYLDTYKATFDPWFLIAAQELAALHRREWDGEMPDYFTSDTVGHFWKPAMYDYYRFAGHADDRRVAARIAMTWASPWAYTKAWNRLDVPYIEESAAAWFLTGDDYYLGRIRGFMDSAAIQVFDGPEPEYLRGSNVRHGGSGTAMELFTGWYIQHFPLGIHALHDSGLYPDPVPQPFFQRPVDYEPVEACGTAFHRVRAPEILFVKPDDHALSVFLDTWRYQDLSYDYSIDDPAGNIVAHGNWKADAIMRIDLPPAAGPGLYRLSREALDAFTGSRAPASQFVSGLNRVPVTPHHVPEVVVFEQDAEGTRIAPSLFETQYWFMVPADIREFRFQFAGGGAKIWDPDGRVAWDIWRQPQDTDVPRGTAVVRVPPEHAGRLWRVTRPGPQQGFVVDPRIPPYFAVSRAKWFDPGDYPAFTQPGLPR